MKCEKITPVGRETHFQKQPEMGGKRKLHVEVLLKNKNKTPRQRASPCPTLNLSKIIMGGGGRRPLAKGKERNRPQ